MRTLKQPRRESPAPQDDHGFSLLEMMVALAILAIVLGVVVQGMIDMQRRNSAENSKVDAVQETRDFIDQMVRDVHDVGYPPGRVKKDNPACDLDPTVACGIMSFSPTQIVYEGDLDGTGTVYRVWMQLQVPASGKCPCTLQRGLLKKVDALAGNQPQYFAQLDGVLNSGNGSNLNGSGTPIYPVGMPNGGNYAAYGASDVFDAYFDDGTRYQDPAGNSSCNTGLDCSAIRSLQISVNVAPTYADPTTKTYPVYSITSKARLNN